MAMVWISGSRGIPNCVVVIRNAQFCPRVDSLLPALKSVEERSCDMSVLNAVDTIGVLKDSEEWVIRKDTGNAQCDFPSKGPDYWQCLRRERLEGALRQCSSPSAAAATQIGELEKWTKEETEPVVA